MRNGVSSPGLNWNGFRLRHVYNPSTSHTLYKFTSNIESMLRLRHLLNIHKLSIANHRRRCSPHLQDQRKKKNPTTQLVHNPNPYHLANKPQRTASTLFVFDPWQHIVWTPDPSGRARKGLGITLPGSVFSAGMLPSVLMREKTHFSQPAFEFYWWQEVNIR